MRMFFHTGLADYVILKEWVPVNWWQYTLTFLAIVVMGMAYELLKVVRSNFEAYVEKKPNFLGSILRRQTYTEFGHSESYHVTMAADDHNHHNHQQHSVNEKGEQAWRMEWRPFSLQVELVRGLFAFFETGLGLILMLVAMTFNVGLFLAVCAGAFFGTVAFGRFGQAELMKKGCH